MRATVAYDRERVRIDISTSDLTGDIQVGDEFRKVIRVRGPTTRAAAASTCRPSPSASPASTAT
jgi:hypothetical protein